MALSDWRNFKDWHLQKKLGAGGFGEVLLWTNATTGQNIATKHIRDSISLGADQQVKLHERWQKEYNWTREFPNLDCIVAGVKLEEKDPQFVQYLNQRHICKLPVIILEYCDGGDVRKRLQLAENTNGLRELEVREILGSLRKALDFLHSQCQVCHRDLKPDNIVIQRGPNSKKIYKLTDFGLARQSPDKTMLQSVVGTRNYFAPEVLETGKYNKSVDYWSLGVIAYELSTGNLPFIPHQTPIIILQNLLSKTDYKYIAITEDPSSKQFKFETKLPPEHNLTLCWAERLEQWLPLALEIDYRKRAATDEVQSNLPLVFRALDELLQIKVLTIFVMSIYKSLAYEILPNMNMVDLSRLISSDSGIPEKLIHFILPTGHPHKKLTLHTRPLDLFVQDWLDTSQGAKHPSVMLYVVHEGSLQASEPKISDSLKFYNTFNFPSVQSWVIQHFKSVVHHVASTEQENLKLFMLGLREYAISLEDDFVQYGQPFESLNEEKLKADGAYELLKRYLQKVGNLDHSEWLILEKEYRQRMGLADKTKSHYASGLRNSKELVTETQRLCKEWIDKDVFNVLSLRQNRGVGNQPEDLKNFIYTIFINRDKFLKDPGIKNLYSSLLKLHTHFRFLIKTSSVCYTSLKDCHDMLLNTLQMMMPQPQPQSLPMLEVNSLMKSLSVNGSIDSSDNTATDILIRESLEWEQRMRQDMETDPI